MIYKYPFLDFNKLNNYLNNNHASSENKLAIIYEKMGGKFLAPKIMSGSVIGICSIGGFPIHLDDSGQLKIGKSEYSIPELKELLYETVGISSFMSYLNPKNKSLNDIANTTLSMKHYSVLHTIHISILISGITIGVEQELSSQRDIVHLSRVTVAKTKSQISPCLVLRNQEQLNIYEQILKSTEDVLKSNIIGDMETRNLLFPTAKSSAIMLTGSLKNFMKLISLKDAGGKEDELVELLIKMEQLLSSVFEEIF